MIAAPFVLLVDGDVVVRHVLAAYLRECGYSVVEAATGADALLVVADRSVPIDVVLCDADLAGDPGGFDLRRRLREQRPEIDVVLAGNTAAAAAAAAALCEEGPQLARPYDPQGVVDHIARLRAARDRGR